MFEKNFEKGQETSLKNISRQRKPVADESPPAL